MVKNTVVYLYDFDDTRRYEFVTACVNHWRNAYIDEDELNERVRELGSSRKAELSHLLPTLPHLKSGEFGEILAYMLLAEKKYSEAQCQPLKWRWKEMQDMPMHGVDVVFLRCDDPNSPNEMDYYVTNEIKSKAVKPTAAKPSQLHEAAEGAEKDINGRISKTLVFLRNHYNKEKNYEMARFIDRFADPVTKGSFSKYHNAVAIVDREHLQKHKDEFNPDQIANIQKIELFLVPIANLKSIYEEVYNRTLES